MQRGCHGPWRPEPRCPGPLPGCSSRRRPHRRSPASGWDDMSQKVHSVGNAELGGQPLEHRAQLALAGDDPVQGGEAAGQQPRPREAGSRGPCEGRGRPPCTPAWILRPRPSCWRRPWGSACLARRRDRCRSGSPECATGSTPSSVRTSATAAEIAITRVGSAPEARGGAGGSPPGGSRPAGTPSGQGDRGRRGSGRARRGRGAGRCLPRTSRRMGEQHPGIEARPPRDLVHPDAVPLQSDARARSAGAGHDHLVDETGTPQLPGEQPHLTLPAAPLAAGRDVDDGGGHDSGSASSGLLSRRRT